MTPVSKITAVKGQVCAFSAPDQAARIPSAKPGRPLLDRLRGQIARIEQREPQFAVDQSVPGMTGAPSAPWCFGLAGIDRHLPDGRLSTSAVHEISGATFGEMPAAMGFALALAVRLLNTACNGPRPVLWCRQASQVSEFGQLYGPGLQTLGLAGEHLLTVSLRRSRTLLWTVEEALKSATLAAVIADMDPLTCDLTATRRLNLAAAQTGTPVLLVSGTPPQQASSAHTRWHVSAAPSSPPPLDQAAPGPPAWTVALSRCRGGKPGTWSLVWHHATHSFSLASGLSHRAVAAQPETGRRAAAI